MQEDRVLGCGGEAAGEEAVKRRHGAAAHGRKVDHDGAGFDGLDGEVGGEDRAVGGAVELDLAGGGEAERKLQFPAAACVIADGRRRWAWDGEKNSIDDEIMEFEFHFWWINQVCTCIRLKSRKLGKILFGEEETVEEIESCKWLLMGLINERENMIKKYI